MKERPILFSAPMIRALREGRKTQTRRILKEQTASAVPGLYVDRYAKSDRWAFWLPDGRMDAPRTFACPYGEPGDRLWTREAWKTALSMDKENATQIGERATDAGYSRPWAPIEYSADCARSDWNVQDWGEAGRQRHARFMPRWASRDLLEVTEVRAQRVQEISEEDAEAEGVSELDGELDEVAICAMAKRIGGCATDARVWYAVLWNQIKGPGSWESNSWVWCVSFARLAP